MPKPPDAETLARIASVIAPHLQTIVGNATALQQERLSNSAVGPRTVHLLLQRIIQDVEMIRDLIDRS